MSKKELHEAVSRVVEWGRLHPETTMEEVWTMFRDLLEEEGDES